MATFALFDEVVNFMLVPSAAALTGEPIDFETDVFRLIRIERADHLLVDLRQSLK